MAGRKRYSVLRDPVHGDVYLTHEELSVLDTPEMQRLRGVKQLGSADLVYPGARHTRFEHSIGTVHVTQRMIDAINLAHELDPRGCLPVGEEETRVVRLAALVHDVTHIPFGHNVEDQAGLMHRHDTRARYEGTLGGGRTALARRLRELGAQQDVLSILTSEEAGAEGSGIPPYWGQLVSDTICSDILDYLARDAYFTGPAARGRPAHRLVLQGRPGQREPLHRPREARAPARGHPVRDRAHARGALLLLRARLLPPRQGRGRGL